MFPHTKVLMVTFLAFSHLRSDPTALGWKKIGIALREQQGFFAFNHARKEHQQKVINFSFFAFQFQPSVGVAFRDANVDSFIPWNHGSGKGHNKRTVLFSKMSQSGIIFIFILLFHLLTEPQSGQINFFQRIKGSAGERKKQKGSGNAPAEV